MQKLLPLFKITPSGILFAHDARVQEASTKKYKEEKQFFLHNFLKKDRVLYSIYRGVTRIKDESLFKKHKVRYDITVLPSGKIGQQAIRTVGHTHTKTNGVSYPEIYQVLSGKGLFLMQHEKTNALYLMSAKKNDIVIVPPEFGHITINANESRQLVVANIFIDKRGAQQYQKFKKTHGPIWYPIWRGGKLALKRNWSYKDSIRPIIIIIKKNALQLNRNSLYETFTNNPNLFDFLIHPKKYKNKLTIKNLYFK